MSLPRVRLTAGSHAIHALVARSDDERERGLMHRTSMPHDEGMLFVYDEPSELCFWMKNTPLALSVAFLAEDGTIINLDDMAPQTRDSHCAAQPVRFVLEMNQGWFAEHGVGPGDRIQGEPFEALQR
ncbi:MAG TPA: DUF192 domain-containing protein [Ramlibacter sp.]|nr:DUF192 domain-containing protein [Ramlibacter sp.]